MTLQSQAASIDRIKTIEKIKNGMPFASALGFTDNDVEQLAELAIALYRQGRLESAEKVLTGLARLKPEKPEFWSGLGVVLTRLERYRDAAPVLTLALLLKSDDTASLVNRAECYFALGRLDDAARDLEQAIRLDPDAKDPAANRARKLVVGFARFFRRVQREIDPTGAIATA